MITGTRCDVIMVR